MKKTFLFTLILALLMPVCAMAETGEQVIKNASTKIARAPMLTVTFTAKSSQGGATSGTLVIAGDRFSLVGPDYGVWYNGTDLWSYSAQTGETYLSTPTDKELLEINPMQILQNCTENYTVKTKSEKGSNFEVQLSPKKKKTGIKGAVVKLNTSTWLPTNIRITFSNGTKLDADVTSATIGTGTPSDTMFYYPEDRYPGIEVIDLR